LKLKISTIIKEKSRVFSELWFSQYATCMLFYGYLSSAAQQDLQPIYNHRYIKNNFEIRVGTNLHAIKRPINCAARCSAAGDKNSLFYLVSTSILHVPKLILCVSCFPTALSNTYICIHRFSAQNSVLYLLYSLHTP
jgi:hypothetical protein